MQTEKYRKLQDFFQPYEKFSSNYHNLLNLRSNRDSKSELKQNLTVRGVVRGTWRFQIFVKYRRPAQIFEGTIFATDIVNTSGVFQLLRPLQSSELIKLFVIRETKPENLFLKMLLSTSTLTGGIDRDTVLSSIMSEVFKDNIKEDMFKLSNKKVGFSVNLLDNMQDGHLVVGAIAKVIDKLPEPLRSMTKEYYHPFIQEDIANYYKGAEYGLGPPKTKTNPNLFKSIEAMNNKYYTNVKHRAQTNFDVDEIIAFIDMAGEMTPVDEYGLPIDIGAPELSLADLASVGPKATSGGVASDGFKHLKTNVYHSAVEAAHELVEKAKVEPENLMIMPLIWSPKSEIIKKNKKLRFFMLPSAQYNILEQTIFGPILNAKKATTVSSIGGSRIMNGTTLERGVGSFIVQQMVKKAGIDVDVFKAIPPDKILELKKLDAINSDYSYYEYQHHLKQVLLTQFTYSCFYNNEDTKTQYVRVLLSLLAEMYLLGDLELGLGTILQLAPGIMCSGIFITLYKNGQINDCNFRLAGLGLSRRTLDIKEKKRIIQLMYLPFVQGDDGYAIGTSTDCQLIEKMIQFLRDHYDNIIKSEIGPAFAEFDKFMMNKPQNGRKARDFLKLVPAITKKGIYFIRPTEEALMRILLPNNTAFNIVTQYYASVSQMLQSFGNVVTYKIAAAKCDMLKSVMAAHNIQCTSEDRTNALNELAFKLQIKYDSIYEMIDISKDLQEMSFEQVNDNFLKKQDDILDKITRNGSLYVSHHFNNDFLTNHFVTIKTKIRDK